MKKQVFDCTGKKVYVGIDVHKRTYSITAICESEIIKKSTMSAQPHMLALCFKRWFRGAKIHSVYEAGFSGFNLHRKLTKEGIKSIVVNPASIEIAANDKVKNDQRDSKKLAEQLCDGRIKGIYIPTEQEELRRTITRTRQQIVSQRTRVALQIKSKLFLFGKIKPGDNSSVSNLYLQKVEKLDLPAELKVSLQLHIDQWRFLTSQLNEIRSLMQQQASNDQRIENIYKSVPGIGPVSARILANELGDLSARFPNEKSIYKYTGLTPSEYSSGEVVRRGNISRQGSARIRWILTEVAWRAIQKDEVLKEAYKRIAQTRGSKRAIVAIARKIIGRIRACFRYDTEYKVGVTH